MKPIEKVWLNFIREFPEEYKIVVDNDSIWVDNISKEECVFQFENYGVDFIVDVLSHFGYNVEHCWGEVIWKII